MRKTESIQRILLPTVLLIVLGVLAPAESAVAIDGLAQESRPKSWKDDAAITDVFFIDRLRGWAVGSQGLLLRTEDGGKTWGEGNLTSRSRKTKQVPLTEKIQGIRAQQHIGGNDLNDATSPFSCRFESVCFKDGKNGWAAGGYDLPYMDHSRAVIARTNDGGKSWQSLPQLMIPRIHKIEFQGAMERLSGWAIGASDPGKNASMFFTSDAGNIWNSQSSKRMPDLIDAERAGNRFVGIDADGKIATFDGSRFEYSVIASKREFVFSDVSMTSAKSGWAVGDDGAIFETNNGGISWVPSANIPRQLNQFDFRCLYVQEDKIWIAGDPGHLLFSIDRKTGEFASHTLNRGSAINRICFADKSHGWAVGDFGKIYATKNGGQRWELQRSGSQRGNSQAGILAVCESSRELPLELIARHAGEDCKLLGVSIASAESDTADSGMDASRLAAERVGAAVVTPIRLPPRMAAQEQFQIRMKKTVREIRKLKPTIVIGSVDRFLREAVELAASKSGFPAQIEIGLEPWQADYLVVTDPNGDMGFDADVFLPRMGMLLEDFVLPGRAICGMPFTESESHRFFSRKIVNDGESLKFVATDQNPILQNDLIKRNQTSIPLSTLQSVQKVGQKRQQMRAILSMPIRSAVDAESCKRSIAQMTFGLGLDRTGGNIAGIWLVQVADKFVKAGKPEQAAWALEYLVSSLPNHCFSPLASTTLAKYYSSSEFNHLALEQWQRLSTSIGSANRIPNSKTFNPQAVGIQQQEQKDGSTDYIVNEIALTAAYETAFEKAVAESTLEIDVEEELKDFDPATVDLTLDVEPPEPDVATTPALVPQLTTAEILTFLKGRSRDAANHFARLAQRDPSLAKRADMQFLQAHIVKQLSNEEDAAHYFNKVQKSRPDPIFSAAASDETRTDNAALMTKVVSSKNRPHLDGLPNDDVWKDVIKQRQSIKITKAKNQLMNDITMLAHDQDYIYVYARCYKSADASYEATAEKQRGRDANLANRDRLEINIDVDRDISSSWQLAIDHQGRVFESCGTAKTWNPKMFVAHHEDDRIWSIECAIPKKDLANDIKPGQTWRIDFDRKLGPLPKTDEAFWGIEQPKAGTLIQF